MYISRYKGIVSICNILTLDSYPLIGEGGWIVQIHMVLMIECGWSSNCECQNQLPRLRWFRFVKTITELTIEDSVWNVLLLLFISWNYVCISNPMKPFLGHIGWHNKPIQHKNISQLGFPLAKICAELCCSYDVVFGLKTPNSNGDSSGRMKNRIHPTFRTFTSFNLFNIALFSPVLF